MHGAWITEVLSITSSALPLQVLISSAARSGNPTECIGKWVLNWGLEGKNVINKVGQLKAIVNLPLGVFIHVNSNRVQKNTTVIQGYKNAIRSIKYLNLISYWFVVPMPTRTL